MGDTAAAARSGAEYLVKTTFRLASCSYFMKVLDKYEETKEISMTLQPRALFMRGRPNICTSCTRYPQLRPRGYVTNATPEIYDVVCVGGGPAGLGLLTALRMEEKYTKPA